MQLTKKLCLVFVLALSNSALAQRSVVGEQCFMDKSQADARQCLEQQVRASEAELSIAEINQRQQIELLGEDVKVRKQMIAAFNASSSQYKNYRKTM